MIKKFIVILLLCSLIIGVVHEIYAFCSLYITYPACKGTAYLQSTEYYVTALVCIYQCSQCGRSWVKKS
jgi:hypothetical protein